MLQIIFGAFLFWRLCVGQGADGSAYLEMGQTKVIAIVNGPREVTRRYVLSKHIKVGTRLQVIELPRLWGQRELDVELGCFSWRLFLVRRYCCSTGERYSQY